MNPSNGPYGDAPGHGADPFRGVSQVEIPRRYRSPRERALAETHVPQWTNLSANRIRLPPPSECALAWRGFIFITRGVTAVLVMPVLFALAIAAGGIVGSLMALQFVHAYIFAALGYFAWYLLAGLLRWTIQVPTDD